MKVQSIPAQITTVEDKIAGNLNLTQILLLMIPVFWMMIVYTLFVPTMQLVWYKIPLFLVVGIISVIHSLRIKEKIVLNWIVILLRYNLRPKNYIFNKNDSYLRKIDVVALKANKKKSPVKSIAKQSQKSYNPVISLGDLVKFENILTNPKFSFSIKSQKKGALCVAVEQNQK